MNIFRNISVRILTFITAFAAVFHVTATPVFAETVQDQKVWNQTYSFYKPGGFPAQGGNWSVNLGERLAVSGQPAYCIEPTKNFTPGEMSSQQITVPDTAVVAAHFGYGYGDRNTQAWYCATQLAVWIANDSSYSGTQVYLKDGTEYGWTPSTPGENVTGSILGMANILLDEAGSYLTGLGTPEFHIYDGTMEVGTAGTDASFHNAIIGKTYTVKDAKGTLATKQIVFNDFKGSVSAINNNSFTITPGEGDMDIERTVGIHNPNEPEVDSNIDAVPFVLDGSQDVITRGKVDPHGGTVTIKATGVPFLGDKKTHDGTALSGAQMQLLNGDGTAVTNLQNTTWTTNGAVHEIQGLTPGQKYILRELQAPTGYVKAKDIAFTASANMGTITVTDGQVVINAKQDKETGTTAQGDAVLSGSQFKVTDGSGNTIDTFSGNAEHAVKNLVEGQKYTLTETTVPTGYRADKPYVITFTASTGLQTFTPVDEVIAGGFEITKYIVNNTSSDFMAPEQGAEFTVVLKSKYTGDIEASYNAITNNREKAKLTTDTNGYAKAEGLAYGTYIGKQTKASPEHELITDTFEFTISSQSQMISKVASNRSKEYYARLVKKDKDSGKLVSLSDTAFQIRNKTTNELVKQVVGGKTYDTFITNSDGGIGIWDSMFSSKYQNSSDTKGKVTTPLGLVAGTYVLEEAGVPNGYLDLKTTTGQEKIEFTVNEASPYSEQGDDMKPIIEVVAENKKPTGTLNITKTIERYADADATALGDDVLAHITFTLTAAVDVIDPADGSVICAKDAVYDTITLNAQGKGSLTGIPMGKYVLKETSAPAGVIKDTTKYPVEFKQEDGNYTKEVYTQSAEFSNKVTKTEISKTDVTGDEELEGATLEILDKDGNVVKDSKGDDLTWVSTDKTYKIEGLAPGEYTLKETIAPAGYAVATDVKFTVAEDGTVVNQVEMVDKMITISKVDVAGEEVEGAQMILYQADENGEIVMDGDEPVVIDIWTSTDETHLVKNTREGEYYIIHEEVTPGHEEFVLDEEGNKAQATDDAGEPVWELDPETGEPRLDPETQEWIPVYEKEWVGEGYAKATDIFFHITGADDEGVKVDQHYDIVNKIVDLTKVDGGDEEVSGAHIQILDEGGEVVDEWISADEPHPINGLEVGKTYTMHEENAPDGYYYAVDAQFTITDDYTMDQHEKMVDNIIRYQIIKVDDKTGAIVPGVTLKLTDITSEDEEDWYEVELPNAGITTDQPFELVGELIAEHTYELEESEYVAGVYKATTIQFTVPKHGTAGVTTVTMMDETTNVVVKKVDNYGNPCAGAEMQILEAEYNEETKTWEPKEDAKPVYEWTSTDDAKGTDVSRYVKGDETYILRESEAPFGFEAIYDTVFKVKGTQTSAQVIVATDVRKHYFVSAVKADKADEKKLLKGAEITLFTKDGEIAKDVNGKECVGLTDGKGVITWEVEYNGDMKDGGYYAQETKAPTGYRINKDKFEVILEKDYDFSKDNPVVIRVSDEAVPATGVTAPFAAGVTGIGAVSALLFIFFRKKKDNGSSEPNKRRRNR